ncbi:hypothetical protein JCM10908_006866 [Rhodotorula pacifica]|uniref:mRNA triphosphatase n=1 Tax=Rhodotorula pacifica TaxID=1495444 RepID=UPI0031764F87
MAAAPNGNGNTAARQPSRSPSIVSILNNPNDQPQHYTDYTDYFGTTTATGEGVFQRATSPTPATAPGAAAPTRTSHKRPRTAGSPSAPSTTSSPTRPTTSGGGGGAETVSERAAEDAEGSMEPPTSRIRRSSSTASIPGPAGSVSDVRARPSSSSGAGDGTGAAARRTSVSPLTVTPPPPPPPAPAAVPSTSSSSSAAATTPVSSALSAARNQPAPPPPRPGPPPPPPAPAASPSQPSSSTAPPSAASAPPPIRKIPSSVLPLEPSIFNVSPIDEFTREVADWIWGFTQGLEWDKVEIEAKIGLLLDTRAGNQRVNLPVPIETILMDDTGLRFDANMSENQHAHFNHLLNLRVEESASPSYPHARLRYTHTRELDSFHADPTSGRKVRVTRDQKDPSKGAKAVEKVRVADMNVFSPKRLFDWRVSVSLETPTPVPDGALTSQPARSRYKDRISYSHQQVQVDLTKVQTGAPTAPPTHELEVEIRNARVLLEEAAKDQRGEENKYLEMVQILLNNIRMLIRNAVPPAP